MNDGKDSRNWGKEQRLGRGRCWLDPASSRSPNKWPKELQHLVLLGWLFLLKSPLLLRNQGPQGSPSAWIFTCCPSVAFRGLE